MPKLSPKLKGLISAPFARAGTTPAPPGIGKVYESIGRFATSKQVEPKTWLAMATGATFTMNSPESLSILHQVSSSSAPLATSIANAETIREVGLKCIGLNGVPRTINCLNAWRDALPKDVGDGLTTKSSRKPTPDTITESSARGRAMWDSIYRPFENKLVDKLAHAHPDLPVHIINSEYGLLFSNPPRDPVPGQNIGRIAMSVIAVSCLRAQTGVGPQVTSHIFGLRKALDDGTWNDGEQNEEGARFLASNEGSEWMLESIDQIVSEIGGGQGTTYGGGPKAKL